MNTQQLLCFLHVADKLSFTKAAEELYLSTPTVTHHIQSLEEELQAQLFVRSKRSVRLSEAGMIFYTDAQDIMSRLHLAQDHVKKMDKKRKTILRIGLSSNTELSFLTKVLQSFHQECPDVNPHPIISNYSQLMHMINDKQLDIVFGTRDMMQNIPSHSFKKIKGIQSFAIVSKTNPLSENEMVSFENLDGIRLITLHPKLIPFKYDDKIQGNIRKHAHQQLSIMCENDQACISLACADYGVAILPEFCIPNNLDEYFVKKIRLIESDVIDYGILFANPRRDPYLNRFIELCLSLDCM